MRKWKITYIGDDCRMYVGYVEAADMVAAANCSTMLCKPDRVISIVEELEL